MFNFLVKHLRLIEHGIINISTGTFLIIKKIKINNIYFLKDSIA